MTAPAAPWAKKESAQAAFGDDEPVFTLANGLLDEQAPMPRFGERERWSGACLPRPSNVIPSNWRIAFPQFDPVWNLRAREVAFAHLNPTHPVLRAAGVFRLAQPSHLTTVRQLVDRIGVLGRWAHEHDLPEHLPMWDTDMLTDFLAGRVRAGASRTLSLNSYRSVLSALYELRQVLTGGGLSVDPAPIEVAGTVPTTPTPTVAPAMWWPLLRAAWTYIDCFAEDILTARDEVLALPAKPDPPAPAPARHRVDERLEAWLADPDTLIPVHAAPFRTSPAGTPMWSVISMLITDGANHTALDRTRPAAAGRRRRVLAEAARGRTFALTSGQAQAVLGVRRASTGKQPRSPAELDAVLQGWLADPAHLVPVCEDTVPTRRGPRTVRTPRWAVLARLIYGTHSPHTISVSTAAGRRRRERVQAAVDAGQCQVLTGQAHGADLPRPTPHFTHVQRADGTTGPWRTHLTDRELGDELRALQGAVYCFVAALSMMRDSEIQEIRRGALTVHYGSPAVRSHKRKSEPAPIAEKWWIIDPVATALTVMERLSQHPTHLFTTLTHPGAFGRGASGRRGVKAPDVIDAFIAHINFRHTYTGLQPIPEARVRPHQFRKTMSVICAQEPDGEIALGIQLKHAARRILANPTTHSYAAPDGTWMREFDDRLATAAAAKLTNLLTARTAGHPVAVGPAAPRLHAGLDRAAAQVPDAHTNHEGQLQALVADARTAADLIRSELPELHLGTLNHCLWQPERAECTKQLPEAERGAPLIGACQPARCRNSAVTADHARVWLAEHHDLAQQLRDRRLPPARRAALQARLDDVEIITTALTQDL
ncbi:hypothetical protein R6V09_00590 [Streptomyces sp. W16]|uniref:hypothetical protein n=1 Tax=Streptomyces sp. W16 TaxID=3076631 RepID=UPI00295B5816|nr:hypothetical protein [Streptomyces sp. W16]MDV9168640.1 hypothetical protein [Streptomyces sp. W16]